MSDCEKKTLINETRERLEGSIIDSIKKLSDLFVGTNVSGAVNTVLQDTESKLIAKVRQSVMVIEETPPSSEMGEKEDVEKRSLIAFAHVTKDSKKQMRTAATRGSPSDTLNLNRKRMIIEVESVGESLGESLGESVVESVVESMVESMGESVGESVGESQVVSFTGEQALALCSIQDSVSKKEMNYEDNIRRLIELNRGKNALIKAYKIEIDELKRKNKTIEYLLRKKQ